MLCWQGEGWCVLLSVLHTQSSPGLAAPAVCTDRPALLKDEGWDSCPPGVSSQLAVQRSPFFLLLFTPCKEFSINKRNCFIINLMFIPSPGVSEKGFEGAGKWSLEAVEAGDSRWWHSPAGAGRVNFGVLLSQCSSGSGSNQTRCQERNRPYKERVGVSLVQALLG